MASIPERGYPLSALFVLMAACAVPMSMAAAAGRAISAGDIGGSEVTFAALGGCSVMTIAGAIVGLYHLRQGLGVTVGALAGAVIGSMVGPITMVPARDFPNLMLISLGGSAVMVGLAAWFRRQAALREAPTLPEWFVDDRPFAPRDEPFAQAPNWEIVDAELRGDPPPP